MKITSALKGISGEFEINRLVGAFGAGMYIITAPAFQLYEICRGGHFDVIAFCAAYPAGLGVAIGAIAGAVSLKDRNVAIARATPAAAPDATAAPSSNA